VDPVAKLVPDGPPTNLFYRDEFAVSVFPVATMLPLLGRIPGDSSSRIALSTAARLKRRVVVRSACPASS
jgi:hypothetical protein